MITIELRDVTLHAYHGIFEGEDKTGSPYIINLLVSYDDSNSDFTDVSDTINYAELYDIIRARMQVPTGLLEKVCDSTIRQIHQQYPSILEIEMSIYKLQPPIEQFQGKVGVTIKRKFNA